MFVLKQMPLNTRTTHYKLFHTRAVRTVPVAELHAVCEETKGKQSARTVDEEVKDY